ncbi:DinB family protein [Paenisporosarcina cavernae]|uniref:DinB family protein n=1 Tax=Paenisporosarcina cavernae TaxID=2320858 RepID=A0A385YPL0_9BACL|nr:DinB family protein [Paenisporosarcina cavernae]AYC28655.1 DinB family protein [Paenisporosarcina cavernae]
MEVVRQMEFARLYSLGKIERIDENEWDVILEGEPNTIRWNAGHIFTSHESLLKRAIPSYTVVHPEWKQFFEGGTRPSEWGNNPPSKSEIIHALQEQIVRFVPVIGEDMYTPINEPISFGSMHSIESVAGVLNFMVWHEGIHIGALYAMHRAIAK